MKTKVNIMYFVIFSFIGYFMVDALSAVNDMTEKELNIPNNNEWNYQKQDITYNYNESYSSYIKIISYDFLQIIMLMLLFIRIYIPQTVKEYVK
jgi:hypothetical protein